MGTVFPERADWVGVLEAAYRSAADDRDWGANIVRALRHVFDEGPITFMTVRFDGAQIQAPALLAGSDFEGEGARNLAAMCEVQPDAVASFFFPERIVNTNRELMRGLGPEAQREMARFRETAAIADAFGMVVSPAPAESAVLFAGANREIQLSRHERDTLTRVALHIEAGLRLRRHPELVSAILEPDGRVVQLRGNAAVRERLREHTRKVERARTRRHRRTTEALALWAALVEGRQSLVERFDGGKRYYHVIENAPDRRSMRALSRGELDVVADAARGLTAKQIAYGLGISESRVSTRLAEACAKLGLASRTDLVRIAAILCHPTRPQLSDAALSLVEKEVLALLVAGLSNAEIARRRGRAVATIANQVASVLAKTGAPSRRALAARG